MSFRSALNAFSILPLIAISITRQPCAACVFSSRSNPLVPNFPPLVPQIADESVSTLYSYFGMVAPPDAASPSRWTQRYLNTRYYQFPEGATVRARIGWQQPRENTDSNVLATVRARSPISTPT